MLNLEKYLTEKRNLIELELQRLLSAQTPTPLIEAMHYSLLAGGKRIRPILCLAATNAVGGDEKNALPAACALEMVHTYSLIHDDLPAMDNDQLRRGHPTCHVKFNEATAILAGDGLLTLAFETLAKAGEASDQVAFKWISVAKKLAAAAGCKGMIEGQMLDMAAEGEPLTIDRLERLHHLKTGLMIESALAIGACLGGGNSEQEQRLTLFGRKIGLAFQVADDILNVKGDPQQMGKAVGTDQARGKNTYPSILGLSESELFARDLIVSAKQALDLFDDKADPLRAIANYIIDRNC